MDYRSNEDWYWRNRGCCTTRGVSYNQVIDKSFGLPKNLGVITEPVTTAVLVKFAKIDSAMATADASNIAILAVAAREACEAWTGVSFVQRSCIAVLNNGNGGVYLPYGPVTEIEYVKNWNDVTLTTDQYKIRGVEFMQLEWPYEDRVTLKYYCGYAPAAGSGVIEIPADLKLAVMQAFFYMWDNRSQGTSSIGPEAMRTLKKYRRV